MGRLKHETELPHLDPCVCTKNSITGYVLDYDCGRGLHAVVTAPLPQRLREAAETIEQWNSMCGLGLNATVSPQYLRKEADRMEPNP